MNTAVVKKNINRLIDYVEKYDNKFISFKAKDENNFYFYFIPEASKYSEAELDEMITKIKAGQVFAYGSLVREAKVQLNPKTAYTIVEYSYPNHVATDGMIEMANNFDNLLVSIEPSFKDEIMKKLTANFREKVEADLGMKN